MPIIIGFGHKKFSGKDLAADYLIKKYGGEKHSFAYSLKKTVAEAFGWSIDQVMDNRLKLVVDPYWGISPAQACQAVGTPLFREGLAREFPGISHFSNQNFWVKRLGKAISDSDASLILIPDVRFPNEANYILGLGGVVVAIDRPLEDRMQTATERGDVRDPKHRSEIALDKYERWSHRIANTGSVEDFERQVDAYYQLHQDFYTFQSS